MEDSDLNEIRDFVSSPERFSAVLGVLKEKTSTVFAQAKKENDGFLRFFCEVAFPALVLWKPKGAAEKAMRKMALTNIPARQCYAMLFFDGEDQCTAIKGAWKQFQEEFPE
mgnify:CR=1 FL=1